MVMVVVVDVMGRDAVTPVAAGRRDAAQGVEFVSAALSPEDIKHLIQIIFILDASTTLALPIAPL